jgi:predicted ATPase/class 3 adenylate cyclase
MEDFQHHGSLSAYVIFIDLSGFTPLTETLMDKGASGVEALTDILDEIFEPLVAVVYSRGGIIPYFAGDAFIGIFPQEEGMTPEAANKLLQTALAARFYFENRSFQFGDFTIGLKIGLASGTVEWGIVGRNRKAFYFRGEPIDRCADAQALAKGKDFSIVVDQTIKAQLPPAVKQHLRSLEGQFYFLSNNYRPSIPSFPHAKIAQQDRAIIEKFLPESIINYQEEGEFRTVTTIFISFRGVDNHRLLNRFAGVVLELISNFSGYFKEIDFGDKGGVMVAFFGAPVSFENNVDRALEFIYALRQDLTGLQKKYGLQYRVGMTTGIAFTGIIGGKERSQYAAVGNRVNLAARLMTYADWGEALVDNATQKNKNFSFQPKGAIKYKGIKGQIPTYKLMGRKESPQSKHEGSFMGRDQEMEALINFAEPLFDQEPGGLVLLYGEAGIGKSRLAHELSIALESTGRIQWFSCQADEILRKSFNPFIFFLRSYFNQSTEQSSDRNLDRFEAKFKELAQRLESHPKDAVQTLRAELLRTRSILAALIGIVYFDSLWEQLDAKGRYENTISAIINLFLCEASTQPTIIEIEDAHWLEPNSLELLQELVRQIKDYPILLLIISRFSDSGTKPVFFEPDLINNLESPILEISLRDLDDKIARLLIEQKLSGPLKNEFFEVLKRTTNKNPFYLQQLLEYFLEQGFLIKKDNKWALRNGNIQLSDSINTILTARIDRLDPLVKETVKTAAVIGREFDLSILFDVMRYNETFANQQSDLRQLLQEQLDTAEQGQIWQEVSDQRYIFKYSLLREAAYNMQLLTRLQTLHHLTAKAIEKHFANKLAPRYIDLAYHYEHADIFDKTCEYLRKAADFARNNYQNQKALDYYERLLGKLGQQTQLIQKIKTLLKKGRILELIGEWDQSIEAYEKALELAKKDRDALLLGQAHNRMGSVMLLKGEYLEGKRYLNAAEQLFESIDDHAGIADVRGNLGNLHLRQGDYEEAKKYFTDSIQHYQKYTEETINPQIVANLGLTHMNQGDFDEGIKVQQKHLSVYEKQKDKRGMATILTFMGVVFLEKGDYDKALDSFQRGLELNVELGNKQLTAIAIGNIGIVYERKGDFEKAMEHYERDLRICEELGDKQGTAIALGLIGQLLNIMGKFYQAIEYLQKDLMICEELGYKKGIAKAVNTLGDIFFYLGQYERSIYFYDRAIEVTRRIGNKLVLGFSLVEKGTVLLEDPSLGDLASVSEEAQALARELGNPDLLFEAGMLSAKTLIHRAEFEAARELLEQLQIDYPEIAHRADTFFELALIFPEIDLYRRQALKLYQRLYQETPHFTYQERIRILEHGD